MTAVDALHGHRILHGDLKPSNFLMFGGDLRLNDFDTAHFMDDPDAGSQGRLFGTPGFWSPRLDRQPPGWKYDEDDDWMGLALTFAFWFGIYTPERQDPAAAQVSKEAMAEMVANDKVAKVELLLNSKLTPKDFKERLLPVFERVEKEVRALMQQAV